MKTPITFLLLCLTLAFSGCSFTRFVDEKGRDCRRNMVYPFFPIIWDTCKGEPESLPAKKYELKSDLKADVQSHPPT